MRKAFPAIAELNRLDNVYFKGPKFAELVKKILASVGEEKAIEFIRGHTKVYADAWLEGIDNDLLDLKYPINPREEHKGKGWTNAERNRLVKDPFQWFLNTCAGHPNAREDVIAQGYYLVVCKLAEKEAIALRKNFKENALAWLKARGIPIDSEEIEGDIRGFDRTFRHEYMASPEKTLRIYENLTVQSRSTEQGQLQSRRQKANKIALETAKRMGLNPVKPEDRRIIKIASAALFDFTPEKEYFASKWLETLKRRYQNIVSGLSETERHVIERNMEGKIREALKIEAPPAPGKNAPSPYLVLAKLKNADLYIIDMASSPELNKILKETEQGNEHLKIRAEKIIQRELEKRRAAAVGLGMQGRVVQETPAMAQPEQTRDERISEKKARHLEAEEARRRTAEENANATAEETRAVQMQNHQQTTFERLMSELSQRSKPVADFVQKNIKKGIVEKTALSRIAKAPIVEWAMKRALEANFEREFGPDAAPILIDALATLGPSTMDIEAYFARVAKHGQDPKSTRERIAKPGHDPRLTREVVDFLMKQGIIKKHHHGTQISIARGEQIRGKPW
ncbi:MAG: hypothetical protein NT067_05380 [Candidatus Diapherotrites archaeon]|nr:hypothetical protein [Candidatus Diapherotrites archaeon]